LNSTKRRTKFENPNTKKVIQFFQNLGCKFIQINSQTDILQKSRSTSTNFLFRYKNYIFFIHIIQKHGLRKKQRNSIFKSDDNTVLQFLKNNYKSKQYKIIKIIIDFSKFTPDNPQQEIVITPPIILTRIIYKNEFKGLFDVSFFNDTGNRIFYFLDWLELPKTMKNYKNTQNEKNLQKFRDQYFSNFSSFTKQVKIRNISLTYFVTSRLIEQFSRGLEDEEPDTLDWIDGFTKGNVFYDVGASTGPFSLYASIKSKIRVVAFEPGAKTFSGLELNHYLNREKMKYPFVALNIAIGEKKGIGKLYIDEHEGGGGRYLDSTVKRSDLNAFTPIHIQYILRESIDELISRYNLPSPNYLKIDVDGGESDVILGAKKTLAKQNVKSVLIELNDKDLQTRTITKQMKKLGFKIKNKNQVLHYKGIYNYLFVKQRFRKSK